MSAPGAQGSRERLVWPRSGRSGTTLCISGKNPVGLWKELIMFAKEGGGRLSRAWEILGAGGKQPGLRGASVDPPGQAHSRINPKDQHHSPNLRV